MKIADIINHLRNVLGHAGSLARLIAAEAANIGETAAPLLQAALRHHILLDVAFTALQQVEEALKPPTEEGF